ncbi:MAG: PilZ domain-containing protein [bacterium]|nr:PilZ domain-containing protein [bacterium]
MHDGLSSAARASERRNNARHSCRIRCQLRRGRRWEKGILVNVSLSGLAVESPFRADEGDPIHVRIDAPGRKQVRLQGIVWRMRTARTSRLTEAWTLGMVINEAGNDFLELVAFEAQRSQQRSGTHPRQGAAPRIASRPASSLLPKPKINRWFRVRVRHRENHSVRLLSVAGGCKAEASRYALEEVGDRWEILDLRPV